MGRSLEEHTEWVECNWSAVHELAQAHFANELRKLQGESLTQSCARIAAV